MHVAGVRADAATFEHVDPTLVGNRRELLISELSGRGTAAEKAAAAGLTVDDATATRIVERVKELEHAGYQFEAADGSFELLMRRESGEYEPLFTLESWRVIVEKRADGKVETEATIKIWVDGERYVRTAEGNGPVNALDAALRDAISEIHPHLRDIELVNYKVRILDESHGTGAVTRVLIDASDGQDVWGAIGVDENVIAASWQALVDSLEYPSSRGAGRAARRPTRRARARRERGPRTDAPADTEPIPLARPVLGEAEERAVVEVLRSGQLSLGPRVPAFEEALRARGSARPHASAVSSGTAGLHLALRAVGVERRRRGRHVAVLVRRERERLRLRARPPGVRRHRPGHAQPRPGRGRGRRHRPHERASCRSTSSATRPTSPRFERLGLPIVEDACEALGAVHADGVAVGRARPPGGLRLLRQQAAHDGRGRRSSRWATRRSRSASTPSATRAARPTWAGSTTTASASTTA